MKIVPTILAVGLVAAVGAAIHLWREVGVSREQIAFLQARIQEQDARIAAAASVTQATHPPAAGETSAPSRSPPAAEPPRTAAAAQTAPVVVSPDMSAPGAQIASPETKVRAQAMMRAILEASYPDLREVLGLSAGEAEKLLDLVAANQSNFSDLSRDLGSMSSQERTRAMAEQRQAHEAAVQAMLGSKYPQWQQYGTAQPAYQQRRDLRAVLNAAGTPLTEEQGQSLIAALSAEEREFSQQVRDALSRGKGFDPMMLNTPERRQRQLDAAAPHLSPQQLASYRAMLERAAALQQAIFSPVKGSQSDVAARR